MTADSIGFYVLSVPGSDRCNRMKARFASESITPTFVPVLAETDDRLRGITGPSATSCAFGHLDMMRAFLESDNEYGIFCEDDIHIRRGIKGFLPELLMKFKRHQLEILLLGYLFPKQIRTLEFYYDTSFNGQYNTPIDENIVMFRHIDRIWGSQMYMLHRKKAGYFLEKYTYDYYLRSKSDTSLKPFSSDYLFTKDGFRAAIYPMMGVEESYTISDKTQNIYHAESHTEHYSPEKYV
jgi:GR25 family glycosyltransferase involved in LPS biosynthesis